MRQLVFSHLDDLARGAPAALDPGVTWFGWHVPALLEAAVVVALGLIMLGIAIWEFSDDGVSRVLVFTARSHPYRTDLGACARVWDRNSSSSSW